MLISRATLIEDSRVLPFVEPKTTVRHRLRRNLRVTGRRGRVCTDHLLAQYQTQIWCQIPFTAVQR